MSGFGKPTLFVHLFVLLFILFSLGNLDLDKIFQTDKRIQYFIPLGDKIKLFYLHFLDRTVTVIKEDIIHCWFTRERNTEFQRDI